LNLSSKIKLNSAFGTKIGTKNGQFLELMDMIACIRRINNPDRYLIQRGRYFYYKRYVPTELQELDN